MLVIDTEAMLKVATAAGFCELTVPKRIIGLLYTLH